MKRRSAIAPSRSGNGRHMGAPARPAGKIGTMDFGQAMVRIPRASKPARAAKSAAPPHSGGAAISRRCPKVVLWLSRPRRGQRALKLSFNQPRRVGDLPLQAHGPDRDRSPHTPGRRQH
jgi:hypothetical protein